MERCASGTWPAHLRAGGTGKRLTKVPPPRAGFLPWPDAVDNYVVCAYVSLPQTENARDFICTYTPVPACLHACCYLGTAGHCLD